jgi:predicted transglutaminase-like cysteine proteinase
MRTISKWLVAIIATTVVVGGQGANAGFVGGPRALGLMAKRFSNFTLPPMAFAQFCLRYAEQCKSQRIVFRGWGEHHLVLVVQTSAGDLVLDNMTTEIRPWARAPYQWVRIQTP